MVIIVDEKIKKDLKNMLSNFRYKHSLMVADEARKLAIRYDVDEDKAYIAGLLHDIAKEFTEEENKKWINDYSLDKEWLKKENSKIVHAEIGAIYARITYNVEDDICEAIRYHALGNIQMNTLDKIVFVADKIARENADEFIIKLKKIAYQSLDKAIILSFEFLKAKFLKEGNNINPVSDKVLAYLKSVTN